MPQTCRRCVMDTSDPDIHFDSHGVCEHCHRYDRMIAGRTLSGADASAYVGQLVDEIRAAGRGKECDCVIGVSGGVDSTFVAYKVKQLGLRPLAVHLDNGWNSELAVKNIQRTLDQLHIDLYTHVIDWNEFRDLQLSFLKAGTPDAEIPSDHAIVSLLFQIARRHGVRYILSGVNARTESHLPKAWSTGHLDWKYIRSVHRRFGHATLNTYPRQNLVRMALNYSQMRWIDVLNYLDYSKTDALHVLTQDLGWKYYGGKHYESIYTRFYQGYYLPKKFGFDKRRSHLSSLICGGEITRAEALQELEKETYHADLQKQDREYVVKKLGISEAELDAMIAAPAKRFGDYPSYTNGWAYKTMLGVYRRVRRFKGKRPAITAPQPAEAVPHVQRRAA